MADRGIEPRSPKCQTSSLTTEPIFLWLLAGEAYFKIGFGTQKIFKISFFLPRNESYWDTSHAMVMSELQVTWGGFYLDELPPQTMWAYAC